MTKLEDVIIIIFVSAAAPTHTHTHTLVCTRERGESEDGTSSEQVLAIVVRTFAVTCSGLKVARSSTRGGGSNTSAALALGITGSEGAARPRGYPSTHGVVGHARCQASACGGSSGDSARGCIGRTVMIYMKGAYTPRLCALWDTPPPYTTITTRSLNQRMPFGVVRSRVCFGIHETRLFLSP